MAPLYPQYVQDWSFDCSQADGMMIVHQAMKGLAYLHSIGIGQLSHFLVTNILRG